MQRRFEVVLEKFAQKQFMKLPRYIQEALRTWSELIEEHGIETMRQIKGYHDEPLRGHRKGQRSARLNRGYRVFYIEADNGEVTIIGVLEVNKHDY